MDTNEDGSNFCGDLTRMLEESTWITIMERYRRLLIAWASRCPATAESGESPETIADQALMEQGGALVIRIRADAEAGTLTVADTGIGMDRQELIDNLGTVARSGTRAFMSRLAEGKDGTAQVATAEP